MHNGSCRMGNKVRTALVVRCSEKPIPISLSDPLMYPLMFKQVHRRNSNSPIKSFTTYSTLGAPCKCVLQTPGRFSTSPVTPFTLLFLIGTIYEQLQTGKIHMITIEVMIFSMFQPKRRAERCRRHLF